MGAERGGVIVTVPARRASARLVARAALEMTRSCWVWMERGPDGVVLSLVSQGGAGEDPTAQFEAELDRVIEQTKRDKATALIRAALVGQALGPVRRVSAPAPAAPALDPETEAEIEKLLAEIESDDWLEDAEDIAKTWEERFGPGAERSEDDRSSGAGRSEDDHGGGAGRSEDDQSGEGGRG